MTAAPVRVLLADDQPLVRSGLRVIMADQPDLEVVGEAATGAEAVQLVGDVHPDVVVMDIRMPGMDGIEATRLITAGPAAARVLILTTFDEDDHVYGALRAGASGFMVKDMALDDILTAIRVVAMRRRADRPGCHAPPDRRVRRAPRSTSGTLSAAARGHHGAGTGSPHPGRAGPVEHGDRGGPLHHGGHRQVPRVAPAHQIGCPGPGPARDHRL